MLLSKYRKEMAMSKPANSASFYMIVFLRRTSVTLCQKNTSEAYQDGFEKSRLNSLILI